LFAIFNLNIRKLEEQGVSAHTIAGLQRYAVIPSAMLLLVTYKHEYLLILLRNPESFWWIAGIAFFWGIAQYIGYTVINSASSLSIVSTFSSLIGIPVMVAMGVLINNDYPNPLIIVALMLLVVAIIIKPTQHNENKLHLLKYSLIMVISLVFTSNVGHALDGALYKNLLYVLDSRAVLFGISVYTFVTSATLGVIYLLPIFRKPSKEEQALVKKHFLVAYSIPVFWFIASIPEGYSFANLPLFTLSALGAFGFLIKMCSDLTNKRLAWSWRTALFIAIIIASIVFSALSLQ